jgi:hypothetical protein
MATDELLAVGNLFQLLGGSADYTTARLVEVGYPEAEASLLGWQTVWSRLRTLLDSQTHFTHEIAAYMERNIGKVNPYTEISSTGEPLDPPTRTFYKDFRNCNWCVGHVFLGCGYWAR